MASELGVQTIQHTNGTDALTIGSDGKVSMPQSPVGMTLLSKIVHTSAISEFEVANVFSDDYVFYKVMMQYLGDNVDFTPSIKMIKTSDGTVDTTNKYHYSFQGNDSAGTSRGGRAYDSNEIKLNNSGDPTYINSLEFTIMSPYQTRHTTGQGSAMCHRGSSGYMIEEHGAFSVETDTSYSGFKLEIPDNFTYITVAVFGLA